MSAPSRGSPGTARNSKSTSALRIWWSATAIPTCRRKRGNGGGLFVYDPFNGTSQQIPINDGQSVNQPVDLITYDGQVYFDNYAVPQGALVGAVGTLFEVVQRHAPQGTSLIANAVPGGPQNPSSMTVFDNKLFMNGVDSNNKYDLFSYNGTTFTKISGTTGLNPTDLTAAGNDLVFNGLDSSGNNALYAYYKSSNSSYVPEKVDPGGSVQSFSHIWFGLSGARHWLKRGWHLSSVGPSAARCSDNVWSTTRCRRCGAAWPRRG